MMRFMKSVRRGINYCRRAVRGGGSTPFCAFYGKKGAENARRRKGIGHCRRHTQGRERFFKETIPRGIRLFRVYVRRFGHSRAGGVRVAVHALRLSDGRGVLGTFGLFRHEDRYGGERAHGDRLRQKPQ